MQRLIAQQSILFENRIYNPGQILPTHNAAMVDAWIQAKTAVFVDDQQEAPKPKAKPHTADVGLCGASVGSDSDTEDIVGKVPKTAARKKK